MGNVASNTNQRTNQRRRAATKRRPTQQWAWNFKDGRAYVKPAPARRSGSRGGAASAARRPLFKKQPSNNYDWWIFNPNKKA